MLKRILLFSIIILQGIFVNAQLNINLLANYPFPGGRGELNDIWGHVDGSGNEYAIVGMQDGVAIVDVSTPTSPVEVFYVQGTFNVWRDIKVWQNFAYITNEGSGGLMIIDMSSLPGAITAGDVYSYSGPTYPFESAHDLFIDENGIAYVIGSNDSGGNPLGTIMLDLTVSATNPTELGSYTDYYLHDAMVRGDTLWGAAISDGFFTVVDVSNKAAPVTMATQNTPNTFTHNCWISDDGQTLYTTDEVSDGYIGSYDVSNLASITELDRVQSSPGQNVVPHNTFFINVLTNDYVVTSYYRDGVTIHDVNNPNNMIEVGNYDTSPAMSGDGYNGVWGVYPYLPSGIILASDIEKGLFVLGPTYIPASYLVGNAIDSITTFALSGVQVDIVSTSATTSTDVLGDYQTGLATAGTYNVTYSKFGYETKIFNGVVLTSGITTTLNVELKPLVTFTLQGQVVEALTLNPIANANVKIWSPLFTTTVLTDAGGNFSVLGFIAGSYDIYIAKWAYNQVCLSNQNLSSSGNPYVYQLTDGYYDDFTFDLGWTVTGNPNSGDWEKGEPNGTTLSGNQSNPDVDSQTDCSDEAYVTGNGGGNASSDDIDGGETVLTSPIFDLSTYTDPYVQFDRWFYNAGGNGSPDDSLVIELLNGSTVARIDFAIDNDPGEGTWAAKALQVTSFMTLTSTMQLRVRAMDINSGHISEAGFDKFEIIEMSPVGIIDNSNNKASLLIYPNPFKDELTINFNAEIENVRVEVYEITGKKIESLLFNNTSLISFKNDYVKGIYFVKVYGNGELIKTDKIIKL